jgi:predicted DNA-binding antitoxin AbrB/MazE fold protein
MGKEVYAIKKIMIKDGKKMHVFVTDNHSEVLETTHKNIAEKMVEVFNANTDNGCEYELITIGK